MKIFAALFALGLVGMLAPNLRSPQSTPLVATRFDSDMIENDIHASPSDAHVIFLGDSITQRWQFHQDIWNKYFAASNPANVGVGGSCVGNVLWIAKSGILKRFHPYAFVVMVGTNDVGTGPTPFWKQPRASVQDIVAGISQIVSTLRVSFPASEIILVGITPRFDGPVQGEIADINGQLAAIGGAHFIDAGSDMTLSCTSEGLHLSNAGYEILGKRISEKLRELGVPQG